MARRGTYAKGQQRHEDILDAALVVIAREGYRHATARHIAAAAGLSQAGLTHYFDSKEQMLVEILVRRDRRDLEALSTTIAGTLDLDDVVGAFLAALRRNADEPGLVQLFSHAAVDAADPAHPAHRYFRERSAVLRATIAEAIGRAQEAGVVTRAVPCQTLARLIQAVGDGVQLQWGNDPQRVDMEGIAGGLFALLSPATLPRERTAELAAAHASHFARETP